MRYLTTRATALVIKFLHIWTPNSDILDDIPWLSIDYFLNRSLLGSSNVKEFNHEGGRQSGWITHIWTTNHGLFNNILLLNIDNIDSNMN